MWAGVIAGSIVAAVSQTHTHTGNKSVFSCLSCERSRCSLPQIQGTVTPHAIVVLPKTDGMEMLLCYEDEGVYVNTYGRITKDVVLQWGEMPTSVGRSWSFLLLAHRCLSISQSPGAWLGGARWLMGIHLSTPGHSIMSADR